MIIFRILISGVLLCLSTGIMIAQQPTATFPQPQVLTSDTIWGDFTLGGDDTLLLENKHLLIFGHVLITDSSHLIMRHSIFEHQTEPVSLMRIWKSAVVEMDTSIIGGTSTIDISKIEMYKGIGVDFANNSRLYMDNGHILCIFFRDSAKAIIRDSWIRQYPVGNIHVEPSSDVHMINSFVGSIFMGMPTGYSITIDSLFPGLLSHWSAREKISPNLPYNLVLDTVDLSNNDVGWEAGVELGWNIAFEPECDVQIKDSKLNKIAFNFPSSANPTITDFHLREKTNFTFNNIRLINTEVQSQFLLMLYGCPATVRNSTGIWFFMEGGDAPIFVHNSSLCEVDPRRYTGTMVMDSVIWIGPYDIFDTTNMHVEGTFRVLRSGQQFDITGKMTIHYQAYALNDSDGTPFPNLHVVLYQDSIPIWDGMTDGDGKVSFAITYDYYNYRKVWYLRSLDSTVTLNWGVNIRSSNPIKINLVHDYEMNRSHAVTHVGGPYSTFPDGTREAPYYFLQEAIDNVAGTPIMVSEGDYAGDPAPGQLYGSIRLRENSILIGDMQDKTILHGGISALDINNGKITGFFIPEGILAENSTLTVTNSIVDHCTTSAVVGIRSNLNLTNNTFAYNKENGIFLFEAPSAVIRNNIIVNNGGVGIDGILPSSIVIDYNDVWGNSLNYGSQFIAGQHDISEDPLFVDTLFWNFQLQSTSPCKDAGDPDTIFNDIDGSRNDMGAFGGHAGNIITGVNEDKHQQPSSFILYQCYPNPFNPSTVISYQLPVNGWVTLKVYNILGQEVATLVNEKREAGRYNIEFRASDFGLSSGVYFYRLVVSSTEPLVAGDYVSVKKFILIK